MNNKIQFIYVTALILYFNVSVEGTNVFQFCTQYDNSLSTYYTYSLAVVYSTYS